MHMGMACESKRTVGGTISRFRRVLTPMIPLLIRRLRELALRRRHREALRMIRVIEGLGLPEDLERAAVRRVCRRLEEALDRYTRDA